MNRYLVKIMFSAAVFLAFAGTASAELVKGKVKAIAGELKLFSFIDPQEQVIVIFWDDKTVWNGINSSADLKLDETLSVDFRQSGGDSVATSVSRLKTPLPAGMKTTSLDQLAEGLNSGSLTLVDSRAAALYDAGHIPGAVSLSLSRLEKRTAGLLPDNKNSRLVFYDEGQGGETAAKAAGIAVKAGYADSAVFPEGAAGWFDSGRFLAASTNFIRKTRPAVIDIRSRTQVEQGHIGKAVNYPATNLKEYFKYLPTEKLTPIVIFGNSIKETTAAAEIIRNRGYRRVTIYPDGAAAWLNDAEVLETGPANEVFASAAANHGGQLQTRDFEGALGSPVMVEIVDVRPASEQKKGGFPNAKQIPLQELGKRAGELNRDKIQVIFAADPMRAEIAYDYLKAKGFRLNYLNGSVEFEKDGKFKLKQE